MINATNYKSYNLSIWYSFFAFLSKINVDDLTPLDKIRNVFEVLTNSLFGENAKKLEKFEDSIKEKAKYPNINMNHIINKCLLCSWYAIYHIKSLTTVENISLTLANAQVMTKTSNGIKQDNRNNIRIIEQIVV